MSGEKKRREREIQRIRMTNNEERTMTTHLAENEDENHADVKLALLADSPDTSVTDDTDAETCREGAETTGEAGCEVGEAREARVLCAAGRGDLDLADQDGGDDKAVDTENTCHNHGNDVLHHLGGVHNTHAGDTDAGLGRAVRRAQVRKHERRGHAHEAEEGRCKGERRKRARGQKRENTGG